MKAVGVYVIVEPIKGEERIAKSGMIVPTKLSDRFVGGIIKSASEEVGKAEFGLKEGQHVLYDKHAGHDIKDVEGNPFKVITCRDIAVVIKDFH